MSTIPEITISLIPPPDYELFYQAVRTIRDIDDKAYRDAAFKGLLARLLSTVLDLGEQIKAFGTMTANEAENVARQADEIINNERPISILVDVQASLKAIADGRVGIREVGIGHIAIYEEEQT